MGGLYCCVVDCKNTSNNSNCKFYKFPTAAHKLEQRRKWISAVNRINPDGSPWTPSPHNAICSAHFVGNKKSEEVMSPSYVPTIFPSLYKSRKVNEIAAKNRHDRFMKRRIVKDGLFKKKAEIFVKQKIETKHDHFIKGVVKDGLFEKKADIVIKEEIKADIVIKEELEIDTNPSVNELNIKSEMETKFVEKECQVYIFFEEKNKIDSDTFVCNRYIFDSGISDVEIQTELIKGRIKFLSSEKGIKKKVDSKKCGTPHNTYVDRATGMDLDINNIFNEDSIKIEVPD